MIVTVGQMWPLGGHRLRDVGIDNMQTEVKDHSINQTTLGTSPYNSIVTEDITVEGVAKLLVDLQSHKAHGPDEIPPCLLKETIWLTLIFRASLHQQQLPRDWKTVHITPVFKKGSRKNPANYRPICLTSIPCKIFEHTSYSWIYKHLENNSRQLYGGLEGAQAPLLKNKFLKVLGKSCSIDWHC